MQAFAHARTHACRHSRTHARNARTHARTQDAWLVHFHGPKPHEYVAFLDSGDCGNFHWMCESAFLK
jgi:hypothetical protein